ncbi:two-component system sensor histidine kinase YesM [Cohnella phaseoli]|uniref:histidine kinase n=2 Tax=Cohnella phaseoli TaxID=456490 RepID=A0A3D9JP96_9BACL|nr:two-component system sensor histidine kinase YesM [Cohnella phaseoli]
MGVLKKMKIKTQFMIAVACVLGVMLLIIYSLYEQTSRIVIRNNSQITEDLVRKFKLGMSQKVEEVGQMMLNLGFDPFLQQYLTQVNPSLLYEMSKELDRKIISLKAGRQGIEDIVLIGARGTKYSLNGGIEYVRGLEPEILAADGVYVSGLQKFSYSGTLQNALVFAQSIYADGSNGSADKRIGYIAVIANVETMFFDTDTPQSEPGAGFYLIDRYGRAFPETNVPDIARNVKALAGASEDLPASKDSIGGIKGSVQLHSLPDVQASLLSFIPEEALLAELNKVRTQSVFIVLFALLLMALPFAMIINNIVHPIQVLVKFINSIKSGGAIREARNDLKLEGNLEMKVVAEKLNGMLNELNSLTHKLVETTTHLLEAEIEKEKAASAYLRSQINPHFLYNTLESIKGVALELGADRVVEMTKALGKLFHYSIKGPGWVTLDRELNAVQSYVFLQLIRFEDRFEVGYDFTEEALRAPVMKMILQPLVENAVFHGLEPKTTPGRLLITGRVDDGVLLLSVVDDGVGVEEQELAEIRRRLALPSSLGRNGREPAVPAEGLGVLNVHNRLRLAYGEQGGLTFDSEAGQGTRIVLHIPLDTMQPGGDTDV